MFEAGCCRRTRSVAPSLMASFLAILAGDVAAQSESPPFGPAPVPSGSEQLAQAVWVQRAQTLERQFFATDAWTFYHDIRDLPPDMRDLLERVAGAKVVGPGEELDLTHVVRQPPRRTQHLYTAVTEEIGVIVWYSSGFALSAHAVLYDRTMGDGCRYDLGEKAGPVLPIKPALRALIQARGFRQGGCEYLPPESSPTR